MMAEFFHMIPDMEILSQKDNELYEMITCGPLIPQIFLLNSKNEIRERSIKYIKKINHDLLN
jgi:hypothetical protein